MASAKYQYAVQETSRPFGPTETPYGFETISQHTTLSAAQKALEKAKSAMRQRCGQGAWDSHQRIIALKDHLITFRTDCGGDNIGGWTSCPDWHSSKTTVEWLAGEPMPYVPSNYICPECQERTDDYEAQRDMEVA